MILPEFGLNSKVIFLNYNFEPSEYISYFVTSIDNLQEINIQLKISV